MMMIINIYKLIKTLFTKKKWVIKSYSYSRCNRGWLYLCDNNKWSRYKVKAKKFKSFNDRHKNIYERWEEIK